MFGWWVWLGCWRFGGISIFADVGTGVGKLVVDIVVVLGSFLPLPLSFFLWVGAGTGGAWAPIQLGGGGMALYSREELLLHLGDSATQCDDLLG